MIKPTIIKFCKKRKQQSLKMKVLKYSAAMALVITSCSAILFFCIDNVPPTPMVENITLLDFTSPTKVAAQPNAPTPIDLLPVFSEDDIGMEKIADENQRLVIQRDIRQLIYPIYNANKPFNAASNDSCYVWVDKNKITVEKCTNFVVKRYLSVVIDKYADQLSAIFPSNKLKFTILLTFE